MSNGGSTMDDVMDVRVGIGSNEEAAPLKCADCGTGDGAMRTTCPYAAQLHGIEREVVLCSECRHQRAQDV